MTLGAMQFGHGRPSSCGKFQIATIKTFEDKLGEKIKMQYLSIIIFWILLKGTRKRQKDKK